MNNAEIPSFKNNNNQLTLLTNKKSRNPFWINLAITRDISLIEIIALIL